LQELLRIVHPGFHLLGIIAQGLGHQGNERARVRRGGILGHEAYFIDAYAFSAGERGAQLLGERRRLGISRRECAYEALQFLPGDAG
jgi:hypothetical protein